MEGMLLIEVSAAKIFYFGMYLSLEEETLLLLAIAENKDKKSVGVYRIMKGEQFIEYHTLMPELRKYKKCFYIVKHENKTFQLVDITIPSDETGEVMMRFQRKKIWNF